MLVVAEPAATLAGAARIRREPEMLHQHRKARLGEFGGLVARIRHDVNRVVAVGVIAPAGAAADHLAGQERLAVAIVAEEAGVADGFLIGRNAAADRLGDDAGEKTETAQQHERPRIGRRGPLWGDQRALRRKHHIEHLADAFMTWISAARSGVSARLRRIGAIHLMRKAPPA